MTVLDFTTNVDFSHSCSTITRKGMADVYRSNYLLSVDGLPPKTRVQKMCETIQGQLPSANIFMSRSIPVYDVRSVDLPREPSGYRNLSACHELQALPCRYTRKSLQKHSGKSKREERLAYLSRLRSRFDTHRQGAV